MKRNVHLVCNAHIDPVWLWERDEGIAAALSTFRCAADFCEESGGFVFNHNEALLYEWTEEFEPALFKRIQRLVAKGRWHIMGGWYLQPDCNMPSGESFVRQMLAGRRYFDEKFGVRPTSAINMDSFGHDRGLVQIMVRAGYDSYLVCRPPEKDRPLAGTDVRWIGYDGSSVLLHRSRNWYNSQYGKARAKVEELLSSSSEDPLMVLWGVGDHGGGASRGDIADLDSLIIELEKQGVQASHSTPEAYFAAAREAATGEFPSFDGDLRPWGPCCYTTMVRVKQAHRRLEDTLYSTEKLLAAAAMNGLLPWPETELAEARRALLFAQFHDILPGSAIREVEEAALDTMGGALDLLGRLRSRAVFALSSGSPAASGDEIPILVFNPHPWPVEAVVECEFQLADTNYGESYTLPRVFSNGIEVPSQNEKESSNINLDWRKKTVFRALLAPQGLSRFDCRLERVSARPVPPEMLEGGNIRVVGKNQSVTIGRQSGLVDEWNAGGRNLVDAGAFAVIALEDDADPWGVLPRDYSRELGRFHLASPEEAARIAGTGGADLEPVRVVEAGPVRVVVEAIFTLEANWLIRRYLVDLAGMGLGIEDELLWESANRMVKLLVPTTIKGAQFLGQGAFGHSKLPCDGSEAVAKRWVAAVAGDDAVVAYTDGTYGSDYRDGTIRLNLLRTPAYAAHPIQDRPLIPADRARPRIDRGLRRFSFRFEQGAADIINSVDRRSLERGERPFPVSFFPPGSGKASVPGCLVDGSLVASALKRSESGDGWILRLHDPSGNGDSGSVIFPALGAGPFAVACGPWEVRTWKLRDDGNWAETDILEAPLST